MTLTPKTSHKRTVVKHNKGSGTHGAQPIARQPITEQPIADNGTELSLAGGAIPLVTRETAQPRMAVLLWGAASAGKSTLAATAPGRKVWLALGDQEHVSVLGRGDVVAAELYKLGIAELFKHAKSDNPFGLDTLLAENPDLETVVVDSATALVYRSLQKAVLIDKQGESKDFTPTMEAPGVSAYGGRNGAVVQVLAGILRITAKHNRHVIITAHEDDPVMKRDKNSEVINHITIMLGGKIVNHVSWRLSEIWLLTLDRNGRRFLAVRPTRARRPMKTRMFQPGRREFELTYDATKPDGNQETIAKWHRQWRENAYKPIPLPQTSNHIADSDEPDDE